MLPILDYRDYHYMDECLRDQDSLMIDVEIQRCVGLNKNTSYPGEKAEILRKSIYTRVEIKLMTLREVEKLGGMVVEGDLQIRSAVELRGGNQKVAGDIGDKNNPDNVADIIRITGVPYQGEWVVSSIPEHGVLVSSQGAMFYNAYLTRVKGTANGK